MVPLTLKPAIGVVIGIIAAGGLGIGLGQPAIADGEASSNGRTATCRAPVLSRLSQHRVAPGETLESIAKDHNLLPTTIMGFNSSAQAGQVAPGQALAIPPYNGIRVSVAAGQTWADVAKAYQSRADLLFEMNGCTSTVPSTIFVPGVNWFPGIRTAVNANSGSANGTSSRSPLQGYPLPTPAPVVLNYGWQPDANQDRVVFNTGIGLSSPADTPILVVGPGTVAFAGDDPVYGKLVVVNHAQGLQTRYANLAHVKVSVGQSLRQGDTLGQLAATSQSPDSILFFEVRLNSSHGWVAQDPRNFVPQLAQR